jgi:hypothetical protein
LVFRPRFVLQRDVCTVKGTVEASRGIFKRWSSQCLWLKMLPKVTQTISKDSSAFADSEKPKPKGRNCVAYSKEDSHTGHNWVSASSASRQPLLPRPLVLALLALLALQSVPNWHRGAK